MRNYEEEVAGKGGQVLYRCREQDCGGDNQDGITATGWHQNVLMKVYPAGELRQPRASTGNCAVGRTASGLRYAAMRVPVADGDAHVAVVTYQLQNVLSSCTALNDRTIVVVVIVEPRAREQRMVTVGVPEMNAALGRDGRIVLYNILFDFDKTDIKPDSKPQIDEIARLMRASPNLRLHVVGHTDNQGQLAYNMDLSRRRAQSVVQALVQAHGIAAARLISHGVGPIAPVAPNTDDAGRARNRRTELVPQ
jgi:outer membrane protein OmpA-like peptidoglycan-associated protein